MAAVVDNKRAATGEAEDKTFEAKKAKTGAELFASIGEAAAGWAVRHVPNQLQAAPDAPYPAKDSVSVESAADARAILTTWEGYEPTPLVDLKEVAELAGVASVVAKDESGRFGTGSFKALGGALAVADCQAADANAVVATASAGNHGLGVAWGAKRAGCESKIYLGRTVSDAIADKMRALGADVVRVQGTYEEACEQAYNDCKNNGWHLIQDGSSEGYEAIPKRIHSGYSLLAAEMLEQLGGMDGEGVISPDKLPTHVLSNCGVGGLAAGLGGYLWDTLKEHRPRFIAVEPTNADCCAIQTQRDVYEADQAAGGTGNVKPPSGEFGADGTIQVGLDCKEVSPLAWGVLKTGCNDFVAIGDEVCGPCLKLLANGETPICAGESAVAGLGVLLAAGQNPELKAKLGLDENSRVAVVICETAPNPPLYIKLTGEDPEDVKARRAAKDAATTVVA